MTCPRDALFDPGEPVPPDLPVCDHYAGVEPRMSKALAIQQELGPVVDVTLDNEDGAPVGGEREHAHLIRELVDGDANAFGRVGVRVLPVAHPAFADVLQITLGGARRPAYVMLPKPTSLADVVRAADALALAGGAAVPLHVLIETHGALRDVQAIASHPSVQSLSFGLMDFVAAHNGAIPADAMTADGQFAHPLVIRAKLEIAAACHASGRTPSHCVVTEFTDPDAVARAARRAADEFGYCRMWSIHPSQIRPILNAFTPAADETARAVDVLAAGEAAGWAPIRLGGVLHDRASFRFYWGVVQRAHRTSASLPSEVVARWFD